jgi:hypothetical protein
MIETFLNRSLIMKTLKQVLIAIAIFAPTSLMASDNTENVRQGVCQKESIEFPDGSGTSKEICITYPDGTK